MEQEGLEYDRMVQDALRGVVRSALETVSEQGFTGDHHFYVTFRMGDPGVVVPDHLRVRYPEEMTIVVQHQFYGLEVTAEYFELTLSFSKSLERLHIPFAAISSFVDPSVNFGLQFPVDGVEPMFVDTDKLDREETEQDMGSDGPIAVSAAKGTDDKDDENVVSLDTFRKK